MHDIDQIRLETETESEMYASGPFESEYFEYGETEAFPIGAAGEVFGETQEMELASEMLEIMNEAELDRFLGNLIKQTGGAVGRSVSSSAGRAVGGILKGAAKQVLPSLGSTVGGYFGGPAGAQLGGQAASAGGRIFGLELEGLSGEDQEFEIARRFVRFAGDTIKNLALNETGQDPVASANAAAVQAAKSLAPGLLQPAALARRPAVPGGAPTGGFPTGHSGRWLRRGNKIVLYGI